MKHIGISGFGHDPSKTITIIENEKVISNINVEYSKINRIKYKKYIDIQNINFLLEENGDTQINIVASQKKQIEDFFYNRRSFNSININNKLDDNKPFENHVFFNNKVMVISHHLAHASYSYYTRPLHMKDVDILTIDGRGLEADTTFYNKTKQVNKDIIGIGMLWDNISRLLFEDKYTEGKTMGLSAYGEYKPIVEKFFIENIERHKSKKENLTDLFPNNDYFVEGLKILNEQIKHFSRENIARTLQVFTENLIFNYLKKYKNNDYLCLSGGLFLNGYINQKIVEEKIYKEVHIPPACNDSGLAFGANLFAINKIINWNPKEIRYTGATYNHRDNKKYKKEYKYIYSYIAKKIKDGKIIAWYQGKSESGPRALGNRSILANPTILEMKDIINEKIKHREKFRPFAPAILKEDVEEWFENIKEAPNMLKICKYKKSMGEKVPSVCHIDYTGRLQTVSKEDNLHFYNLIKEFKEITGIPILLNTSFNDNNEPIVETPADAIYTFKNTDIDILVINDFIYEKEA